MNDEKSLYEILMDDQDCENIVLEDQEGNQIEFEQFAIVCLDDKTYCILRPVNIPDYPEDQAEAFLMQESDGDVELSIVEDEATLDRIFEEYQKLCEDE